MATTKRPKPFEILSLRHQLGIPLTDMAHAHRVTPQTIRKWEDGEAAMPRKSVLFYQRMIKLSPHLLARRAKPDWTL